MYTTHGLMTAEDYREHLKDTDQGTTEIDLDDVPAWFDAGKPCPVCPEMIWNHVRVLVADASGEVFACDDGDGWQTLPAEGATY